MAGDYNEWVRTMESQHGAAWRDVMRERASKGGKAKVTKGLGRLSPERRAEIARMGVEARKAKRNG